MSKKEILIIDDDHDIVNVLTVILQEYDFAVRKAYTGSDGLSQVRSAPPDLILVDYMLPDINGDEIASRIKKIPERADIPIIMISAAHNAEKVAEESEMDGYISKPFEIDDLLKTLRTFLSP